MKIEVTLRRHETHYVGRPTPLGNPFPMRGEFDRDRVCDLYEKWFADKIAQKDQLVLETLRQIWRDGADSGHVRLGCYCAPRRCHAQTIARFLTNHVQQSQRSSR